MILAFSPPAPMRVPRAVVQLISLIDEVLTLPDFSHLAFPVAATGTLTIKQEAEVILSTAEAIREIKAISGLPWDRVAAIFGRQVRTVHLWADGHGTDAVMEAAIRRVHALLVQAKSASPLTNRQFLLTVIQDGETAFALLQRGEYRPVERALEGHLAGAGSRALPGAPAGTLLPGLPSPDRLLTANPELGASAPGRVTRVKVKFRSEA